MKNRRVHFAFLAALCLATIVAAVRPSRATIGNVTKSYLAGAWQGTFLGNTGRRSKDRDGLHRRRGIWHYKLKIDGRWKERSTHTDSYEEAKAIKVKAQREQEEGRLPTDMAKRPFKKAAEEWLAGRSGMVAIRTVQIDKERLVPLRKAFAGLRLEEIVVNGGRLIRSYQLKRTGQVSNRTINLETKVLRMILRSAKLWSRVADDDRGLPENKRGPARVLTPEEEKRLWDVANSNPNWVVAYCAALIAANTTARGCEIRGLRIADVDLATRVMKIRRASTKTDAGCRVVPLNATATWALARRTKELALLEPDWTRLHRCGHGALHGEN